MEKILIAIDCKHGAWEALYHACSLAKRIRAQINVLFIVPPASENLSTIEKTLQEDMRKRLSMHIEQFKSEGIMINLFMTEGSYEDEIIRFIRHNRITLMLHESRERDGRSVYRHDSALSSLRHRISCRVEIVSPKKTT